MATENPFSCFLENRDATERLVFWLERLPSILVPLVFFFSPAKFVFTYLICIPILAFTNSTYLFCFSIREDITDDEASHRDQQTSPMEEVELLAFALERVGALMLFFSCSYDPLAARITFILIALTTVLFISANLAYFGCALCRMLEIDPQELREGKKKEVASQEKKFGLPENVMDANDGEKTNQLSIDTILERIQKLAGRDMLECSEINKDDDIPDLVEGEDSDANERPRVEEDAEAAEDERGEGLFPDSEGKNTNYRGTVEDNFERLNTRCGEYNNTKKLVEAMEESYRNKLKKKKNHWEKQLKQVAKFYEEDRQKWEKEKKNLVSQLFAATAQYEFYHTLYCNHEENRLKWEDEKNDLITKFSFAAASCELYKNLLHDLFSNSE